MILILNLILVIQILIYLSSPIGEVSFLHINSSALLTFFSFLIYLSLRRKTFLKKHNFSIITFFFIMSYIISFQFPVEISLGNLELLNYNFIYDSKVLNKMVSYSAIMLDVFLIGATISLKKIKYSTNTQEMESSIKKINTQPVFILLVLCFVLFVMFIDPNYLDKGHGSVKFEGISQSSLGIFTRLSVVYIAITLFNNQKIFKEKITILTFTRLFNKLYLSLIVLISIVFLLAHNRFYVIYLVAPFLFSFFIYSKKSIRTVSILILFFGLSVFGTLFKIYGFIDLFKSDFTISEGYLISLSYFPFTAELAGSIYSQTILYEKYISNDLFLFGSSYLIGFFRTIPGLMNLLDLNPISYDTATIATSFSGVNYGVGTTSIIDFLINFGLIPSIILFYIVGRIFSSSESKVYKKNVSLYDYVIFLTITSNILFIPRGSLNDLLGMVLFNLLFVKVYSLIYCKN